MNILVVGEANTWFDNHVSSGLQEIGHRVSVFHYGNAVGEYYGRARRSEREQKNRDLLQLAKELKSTDGLDLIFCYVYDDFLLPEIAAALCALKIPMFNYNVDMTNQWYRQIRTARYFTGMLCAQRVHMDDLARYGAPVHYFPMAARPPICGDNQKFDVPAAVTFVGSPMPYRVAVLKNLVDCGIPLAIYGKFWSDGRMAHADRSIEKTFDDIVSYGPARLRSEGLGALWATLKSRWIEARTDREQSNIDPSVIQGFLPEERIANVFRNSKINIGFTRMTQDDPAQPGITQPKLRDFEVPACGGFYLVEHTPDYEAFFENGQEVETWRTVPELVEKTRYYLEHESERATIAAAGQRRALREHLWKHRFSDLFGRLGVN